MKFIMTDLKVPLVIYKGKTRSIVQMLLQAAITTSASFSSKK